MLGKRINKAVLVACVLIISTGCSTVNKLNEKTVSDNNVFTSPFPKFQIQVNPDFEYLGEFKETISASGSSYQREVYFLGQIENNIYKKGVLLDFLSLPNDLRWHGSPDLNSENTLKSGTMDWSGIEGKYIIVPGTPFGQEEKSFLTEKGYKIPQCYLLKISAQQQSWARVYMLYFDQLPSCEKQWNPTQLSQEQQTFLDSFVDKSMTDLVFQSVNK